MYESKIQSEATDRLFQAILSLQTKEECYRFFDDLCTYKEVEDMSQRFQVAEMLEKKMTFVKIAEETGVSSATVTRVNRCLHYGSGGYQMALDRMN